MFALCYFAYGLSLLVIAPALNFLFGGRLSPYRGSAVTLAALRWYVHCTMTLVVRYSFLEFVTPSPFSQLYYRLMGMRIGRGVTLNSTAIADPSLIELGDHVTVGGSANILAHYAQGGFLVIAPVKIGAGATIGMRAIIMGGVEVGEKAKVLANSFVLPNTKIPRASRGPAFRRARSSLPSAAARARTAARNERRRFRGALLAALPCPRSKPSACASSRSWPGSSCGSSRRSGSARAPSRKASCTTICMSSPPAGTAGCTSIRAPRTRCSWRARFASTP